MEPAPRGGAAPKHPHARYTKHYGKSTRRFGTFRSTDGGPGAGASHEGRLTDLIMCAALCSLVRQRGLANDAG